MLRIAFVFVVVSTAISARADSIKADFCSRSADDIRNSAYDSSTRIAFQNHGGIANGGVCWWHSRMQRASLYLAVYRPELARPTRAQATRIAADLAHMKVTQIPGYSNFRDFSADFADVIEKRLEKWQLFDGIVGFRWIDGLSGSTHLPPARLQAKIEDLYKRVVVGKQIVLDKLQMPGIVAHAWLVLDVVKNGDGYTLKIIDSNIPGETTEIRYRFGDDRLYLPYGPSLVPYVDYNIDLVRIRLSTYLYCAK